MEEELEIENTETFNRLKILLETNNLNYNLIVHAPAKTSEESAKIRNTTIESGAKALILKTDKEFVLLVISAALKFNSKQAKKILKTKNLSFANLEDVKKLTGCLNGAVPPFGSLFNLTTYVDESLFNQGDTINFNAGLRTHSMVINCNDYKIIENPIIINISENK